MKTTRLKLISALVPYVAVIIGLYVLENAWLALGLYHVGIAMFIISNRTGLFKSVRCGWNFPVALISIAACALIFPTVIILWKYMELENLHLKTVLAQFGLAGLSWYFFMIYFSTVHPFLEELFWRGCLENKNRYPSWTDFAFAGYHILVLHWFIKSPWLIALFILLTVAACVWRFIARGLKGLAVPLLSHIVADISIVAAANVIIK